MRILYNNLVASATITASSENPDYLITEALVDTRLSIKGRTTDDDDEYILFTFSGAVSVSDICIIGHNITSSATITLQANSSNSWGAPAFSESITSDDLYDGTYYAHFTSQSYRYWRLWIDDASNPDTYIEVSYIFLGVGLDMPGMNLGQVLPRGTTSIAEKSPGGQLYGTRGINPRGAEISFEDVDNADKVLFEAFLDDVDIITPFVLLIWEDSLSVQAPVYVALTELPKFTRSAKPGLMWNFSMKVEECF